MDLEIKLWVKTLLGEPVQMSFQELDSIGAVKRAVEQNFGIRKEEQSLIYYGEVLEDEHVALIQKGIVDGDCLTVALTKVRFYT